MPSSAHPKLLASTGFDIVRLAVAAPELRVADVAFNAGRLQSGADRCLQMAQQERGDIVRLTAHLIIQMVRDKDRTFSKRPLGASMALILAWLHRNGFGLALETEELVAATRAIAAGGVYLEDLDQYLRQYVRQMG